MPRGSFRLAPPFTPRVATAADNVGCGPPGKSLQCKLHRYNSYGAAIPDRFEPALAAVHPYSRLLNRCAPCRVRAIELGHDGSATPRRSGEDAWMGIHVRMPEAARLESDFGEAHRATSRTLRRAINSTTCLVENAPRCDTVDVGIRRRFRAHLTQCPHDSALHLTAYVGMFFRTRQIAGSKRFGIEHAGPARFDCPGPSRVYTDRNSGDRRVQRNSAAGIWMVGPPSSWSRDQEGPICAGPFSGPLARRSCVVPSPQLVPATARREAAALTHAELLSAIPVLDSTLPAD